MTEKRRKDNSDPTSMALEAANKALAAANAAVQAAVNAIALTRNQATKGARRSGAIRSAASQARGRMTGRGTEEEATGVAPLAAATPRAKPAPRAKRKPAAKPKPRAGARKPARAAAEPSAPSSSESAFAQRKRSAPGPDSEAPSAPPRTGVRKTLGGEDAPARTDVPDNGVAQEIERQATQRPSGAAPIQLGPSFAPPAEPETAPASHAPSAPPTPAPPAVDPAVAARREAELAEREAEIAEREAAMAQYQPMEPAHAVPAKPQAEPNGLTVLVVDDEEQVRALTVRILSRFGYRVLEASGVEIAMAILDQPESEIDLVLSDVAMPGLSGKDLFRAISETRPGLPVVFMSGYALGVYAPEGLVEEGVKMLPKPFGQEDLLDFVTEALEGAGRA